MLYHAAIKSVGDTLDFFPFLCPTRALGALNFMDVINNVEY